MTVIAGSRKRPDKVHPTGLSFAKMPAKTLSTKEELESLVSTYETFLFDCDGVIWEGDHLIPNVAEALAYLRKQGKQIFFVTNNATKSRQENKKKFDSLGIQCEVNEIFSSAFATAAYLKNVLKFPQDKKVYVIGELGIEQELDSVDIKHCGGTNPEDNVLLDLMDFSSIVPNPEVGAVVCGLDMHFNYKKIARAHRYLNENPGCLFIATNLDSTFPTHGNVYPGGGVMSTAIGYAANKKPLVIGKPEKPMLDSILETYHLDKSKTIMVGDRLDTDILFGNNGGIATLMVLTGINKREDFESPDAVTVPQYVVDTFGVFSALA